ncbi:MAG: hypothetical protein JW807_16355 [Spirochaetes bacterium]|nr:hypothetical protein [Spirochaetota bacterium]
MKKPKKIILCTLSLSCLIAITACGKKLSDIMTVTGATPLALRESVPSGRSIVITGMVKKEYNLSSYALNKFATVRVRTREVSPSGEFEGAYVYTGIPLYNILEGVTPEKPKTAPFDRPLDMVVVLHSASGKTARFSYGELIFTDDRHPCTLAFHRRQVLPSKDPDKYTKNRHKGDLEGLRLICPRDPDTARYLDDVTKMTLEVLKTPDDLLPVMKKGAKCSSDGISAVQNGTAKPVVFEGVERSKTSDWVRIGHGQGYKGISSAGGYDLRSFLKKNFKNCGPDNFFLFVACDGYRVLFSGREIFGSADGASYMIVDSLNGKDARGKYMLAPVADYFVDRDVWGLTHIVMLDGK